MPADWAASQNNLGAVLQALGEREGSLELLNEAIAAFRAALEVRTRADVPIRAAFAILRSVRACPASKRPASRFVSEPLSMPFWMRCC